MLSFSRACVLSLPPRDKPRLKDISSSLICLLSYLKLLSKVLITICRCNTAECSGVSFLSEFPASYVQCNLEKKFYSIVVFELELIWTVFSRFQIYLIFIISDFEPLFWKLNWKRIVMVQFFFFLSFFFFNKIISHRRNKSVMVSAPCLTLSPAGLLAWSLCRGPPCCPPCKNHFPAAETQMLSIWLNVRGYISQYIKVWGPAERRSVTAGVFW